MKLLWQPNSIKCSTSHQQHPEEGDVVSPKNDRKPSHLDVAVCTRTFHWL